MTRIIKAHDDDGNLTEEFFRYSNTRGGSVIVDHRTRDSRPISEIGFWAVATDKFLSGWGNAPGRSLVAYPLTGLGYKQQQDILAMMDKRQDFRRVRTNLKLPRLQPGDHLSIYDAPDLS